MHTDFAKIIRAASGQQVVYMKGADGKQRPAVLIVTCCSGFMSSSTVSFDGQDGEERRGRYFERVCEIDAERFAEMTSRTMAGGS
ncbi:hypothetical protein NJI34_34625 [Pseudomonas sp. S 311-6]|nr:hypothetical protein [Pseudomonas sp. S 311-6]